MNGTHLTLGLVGALAAAGALSRRGSRAEIPPAREGAFQRTLRLRKQLKELNEAMASADEAKKWEFRYPIIEIQGMISRVLLELPEPSPPRPGVTPRYQRSYMKGKAWAYEQLSKQNFHYDGQDPLASIDPKDLSTVEQNLSKFGDPSDPNAVKKAERYLGRMDNLKSEVERAVQRLTSVATRKLTREYFGLNQDQRAFWDGVRDYTSLEVWNAQRDGYEFGFQREVREAIMRSWLERAAKVPGLDAPLPAPIHKQE